MINKTNPNFKSLKAFIFTFVFFITIMSVSAFAMEDGAYLVTRNTSYVNPQTGQTVDGGTNIALGESMCASMIESQALVEQSDGRTYVTLGIGMMSNITSVRIQVQSGSGYSEVPITLTGSCQRDGDTCNHYRFEVSSVDNYISPIVYVEPMGREVQFFVSLNSGSATAGTGNFVSEMVTQKVQEVETKEIETQDNSTAQEVTESVATSTSQDENLSETVSVDTNSDSQIEETSNEDSIVNDESSANSESSENESNKEDNSESDTQNEDKDIMLLTENNTDSNSSVNNSSVNNSTETTTNTNKSEAKAVESKSSESTESSSSSVNIGVIAIIAVVCVIAVGGVLLYRKKSR